MFSVHVFCVFEGLYIYIYVNRIRCVNLRLHANKSKQSFGKLKDRSHTGAQTHPPIHTRTQTPIHIQLCVLAYGTYVWHSRAHTLTLTYTSMHTYIRTHTYIYTLSYTCTHVSEHVRRVYIFKCKLRFYFLSTLMLPYNYSYSLWYCNIFIYMHVLSIR